MLLTSQTEIIAYTQVVLWAIGVFLIINDYDEKTFHLSFIQLKQNEPLQNNIASLINICEIADHDIGWVNNFVRIGYNQ